MYRTIGPPLFGAAVGGYFYYGYDPIMIGISMIGIVIFMACLKYLTPTR